MALPQMMTAKLIGNTLDPLQIKFGEDHFCYKE
jgi:hypothetical protein